MDGVSDRIKQKPAIDLRKCIVDLSVFLEQATKAIEDVRNGFIWKG